MSLPSLQRVERMAMELFEEIRDLHNLTGGDFTGDLGVDLGKVLNKIENEKMKREKKERRRG